MNSFNQTFFKRILLLGFLLALLAGGIYAGRYILTNLVMQTLLIPTVESKVQGLHVKFGSANCDLTTTLVIKKLTVSYQPDDRLAAELYIPELRYEYSWRDFGSLPDLIAHSRINTKNAVINLTKQEGQQSQEPLEIALPAIPFPLPAIDLHYRQIKLILPKLQVSSGPGTIETESFSPAESRDLTIQLRGKALVLERSAWRQELREFEAKAAYAAGQLRVDRLRLDNLLQINQALFTSREEGSFLQTEILALGGTLALQASLNDTLSLSFATRDLAMDQLTVSPKTAGVFQKGRMNASGTITMPITSPTALQGQVKLSLLNTDLLDTHFDTISVSVSADNGSLLVENLSVRNGNDNVSIHNASLSLSRLLNRTEKSELEVLAKEAEGGFRLTLNAPEKFLPLLPQPLVRFIKDYSINNINCVGQYAKGQLFLSSAALNSPEIKIQGSELKADLTPWLRGESWDQIHLQGEFSADVADASAIHDLWPDFPFQQGRMSANFFWDSPLGDPSLRFSLHVYEPNIGGIQIEDLEIAGTISHQQLSIESAVVHNGKDHLKGQMDLQLFSPYSAFGSFDFELKDLGNYLPEAVIKKSPLAGDLSGHFTLKGPLKDLDGEAVLHSKVSRYDQLNLEQTELVVRKEGGTIHVDKLNTVLPETGLSVDTTGRITHSGDWTDFSLYLDQMAVSHEKIKARIEDQAQLRIKNESIELVRPLTLAAEGFVATLSGTFSKKAMNLDLDARISSGPTILKALGGAPFSFQSATFQAELKENIQSPLLSVSGGIQQIVAGQAPPLDGKFSLAYNGNVLAIEAIEISDSGQPKVVFSGHAPLQYIEKKIVFPPGDLVLDGEINLQESPVVKWLTSGLFNSLGNIQGEIALHGSWKTPMGMVQLRGQNILPRIKMPWLPQEQFDLDLNLQADTEHLNIEKAIIHSGVLDLQLSGQAENRDLLLELLKGKNTDSLSTTQFEVSGQFKLAELDWLAARAEILRRTSGDLTGTFNASGSMEAPHLSAELRMANGELRLNNELPVLRNITFTTSLEDNILQIDQLKATLGGAPLFCRGSIALPYKGRTPEFALHISGQNMLFYRAEGIKFRGDADLTITGSTQEPILAGTVSLTDSRVMKNIDFLSSLLSGFSANEKAIPWFPAFPEPPLRDTRFNVQIETVEPTNIASNIFKGRISPSLRLQGTGEVPFVTGNLYINSGVLSLPAGRVNMDSGLVHFTDHAPDRPELEMSGTAKMKGYDISITVTGPYDTPVIMLSSTPPLPNDELLMLLLTGKAPVTGTEQAGGLHGYSNVALYLGRNLIDTLWTNGNSSPDNSVLERLQLDIGRNMTQKGEETIEAQFILAEDFRGKKNALLLTGEKDIWDKYNGGLRLVFKFH